MTHFGRLFFAVWPAKKRAAKEAQMNKSAIVGSLRRPRVGYIATIVGALLGGSAIAVPAHSGDLYNPYYQGIGYRHGCHQCGCSPCGGCSQCGCSQCGYPQYGCCAPVRRSHVMERHWVEREYYERRYPVGGHRYYRGYADSYESGYPRHPGYGYGYGAPRPYAASYDYDEPPRPPAAIYGVRAPFYYDGYGE
jgi:hypothetical protein